MTRIFPFTSESVSEGHPDKICDQISDAILDAYLKKDSLSRVACEVLVSTNFVCIAGEISSEAKVDVEEVSRQVIRDIGYVSEEIGFNADTAKIMVRLHRQSQDISQGVSRGEGLFEKQGAGDQGMMFGFATNETTEYMPAPIAFAHKILQYMSTLRHKGQLTQILPDSKSQVTVNYVDSILGQIDMIVVSTQHREDIKYKELEELVIEGVIKKVIPNNIREKTRYLINPTGRFVTGGPHGDAGLTGRKIIVDTYGGWGRHGGGAFSGKDPTKVDRSGAYMARYSAKNIVAAGLADRCEIQLAYAIGYPSPVSICIETFGTEKISIEKITKKIMACFDFSPRGIIDTLDLLNTKERNYRETATYGHFGRDGETFSWERLDKVEELQNN